MVLKGVDGVIFVADSDPDRMAANAASLKLLDSCLGVYEKGLSAIPCVIQCNKRDLPNAAGMEEMGLAVNLHGLTMVPAVARRGEGVLESMFKLVKVVLKNLRAEGLELDRKAGQLHRMTKPAAQEHHEATSRDETDLSGTESAMQARAETEKGGTEQPEAFPPAAGGEPVIEFAGEPEILRGGGLRLPLTIRYDGKEKRIAIDISLRQDLD
jgi:uncharacterized protein